MSVNGGAFPPSPDEVLDAHDDTIHVEFDGDELLPAVYQTEATGTAKMTEYTDQCGYSESEKLGPGTMTLTLQAILYKSQVQRFYAKYEDGDAVEVTHPAEIGTFTLNIQDFTITQEGDHNEFVDGDGVTRDIFNCQIQLKSPGAESA